MDRLFLSIFCRGILPNLAKLISQYTQDVIANRRGIANALFGWLRTSSSSNMLANSRDEELALYHSDTLEFKIRFVADMAFLLHVEFHFSLQFRTTKRPSTTTNWSSTTTAPTPYPRGFPSILVFPPTHPNLHLAFPRFLPLGGNSRGKNPLCPRGLLLPPTSRQTLRQLRHGRNALPRRTGHRATASSPRNPRNRGKIARLSGR